MAGVFGTFLLLLSVSSSGLAWTFFENGGSLDDPTHVYPYPRIVLMGPSGAGKSTLANVLAGCLPNDNSCFKTCPGSQSCTNETTLNVITYLGDDAFGTLTLVDTPGFGHTEDGGDGPIITNIIDVLKHSLGDANMILLCLDYPRRFGPTIQNMITELESLFGRQQVWDHVGIEVTKWHFTENDIIYRNISGIDEDFALADINEQIKKISHLNKTLPGVFIDSFAPMFPDDASQQEYYQKYTQDLWDMAVAMPKLEFLSIEDILEELSECREVNDCLNGVLEERLAQVQADVMINKAQISNNSVIINENGDKISQNVVAIRDNSDAIRDKSEELEGRLTQVEADVIEVHKFAEHNSDEISTVDATVTENKGQISNNADMIKENRDNISQNFNVIKDNSVAIGDNYDAIYSLKHTPVVGVCAYRQQKSGTGTITYESISGTSTDGSSISTTTGKYTVKTQGLYSITYSAYTHGQTDIYLFKDGAKQDDTDYYSNQGSGYVDQGSNTVVRCLTEGQEIHLEATYNTIYISSMQFCVTLLSEASC